MNIIQIIINSFILFLLVISSSGVIFSESSVSSSKTRSDWLEVI